MITTLIIISTLLTCICTYFIYRAYILAGLIADQQDYVEEIEQLTNILYLSISNAYEHMKRIDTLGAFESDDESGTTFQLLKQVLDDLNEEFNGPETQEE